MVQIQVRLVTIIPGTQLKSGNINLSTNENRVVTSISLLALFFSVNSTSSVVQNESQFPSLSGPVSTRRRFDVVSMS